MKITPDQIITFAEYTAKFGPAAYTALSNLLKKADPTLEDADALFANLKPYESFGIPDVAPTAPTVVTGDDPSASITTSDSPGPVNVS